MNKNLTFVSITISILILLIFININNPSTTFIIFNSSSPILKEIDAKPIAIENIAGSDKTGKISCSVDGKKLNFAYKVQKGEKITVDDQTCNVKAGGNIEFTDPEGNSKVLNNEQNLVKFFGISGGPSLTDNTAAADKAAADKAAADKSSSSKKQQQIKQQQIKQQQIKQQQIKQQQQVKHHKHQYQNKITHQWLN